MIYGSVFQMRRSKITGYSLLSAIFCVGILYGECRPLEPNNNLAAMLDAGITCYNINDLVHAKEWWEAAATDPNDSRAEYYLGILLSAYPSSEEDQYQATEYFHRAANQGLAEAQYNYGYRLSQGIGTTSDERLALQYIMDAANQGLPEAQYDLGYRYFVGDEVLVSQFKSYVWLVAAASSGVQQATDGIEQWPWELSNREIRIAQELADFRSR